MFSFVGSRHAQSTSETPSCRPINQRPRDGAKCKDTCTSGHPDSNSTTTPSLHTTAQQVSPAVMLLTKSHVYAWNLTTIFCFCYTLDLFPDYHSLFMITDIWTLEHWVNFTSIWTHLFCTMKLCWTMWPPCREEADRTPWCCTSSKKKIKGVRLSSLRYCTTI